MCFSRNIFPHINKTQQLQQTKQTKQKMNLNYLIQPIISFKRFLSLFFKNIWLVSFSLYSLWILLGVFYYKFIEGWNYATSYYYSIEAGLSIGFCYPSERSDITRVFTIFYVLLGSSVVVGSLAGLGNELIGEKKVYFSLIFLLLLFYFIHFFLSFLYFD